MLTVLVAFFLTVVIPSIAQAASYTVTKTADTKDGSCDADCSLREAIIAANVSAGTDTVTLPSGTYALTLPGKGEDQAATGDLDITGNLILTAPGAPSTIIDGTQIDRVVDVHPGTSVEIHGVTIRNGYPGTGGNGGGGIFNRGGTLTVTNSAIKSSRAAYGGGILARGTTTLVNTNVSGNSGDGGHYAAADGLGGGIYVDGAMTLNGSTVSANTAPGVYWFPPAGGGIFVTPNGNLRLNRSTISGNYAGTGIVNLDGRAVIENSTISGNTGSTGYGGGGILNYSQFVGGSIKVISSTIAENKNTWGRGDAIGSGKFYGSSPSGSITVKNSILASPSQGWGNDCYKVVLTSLGRNVASDGSCGLTGTGDLNSANPLLASLADNSGPTMTHLPTTGSPVIDKVPTAALTDSNGLALSVDQRGVSRPQGAAGDIGAAEMTAPCTVPAFSSKTDYSAGGGPVSVATADLNKDGVLDVAAGNSWGMTGMDPSVSVLLGSGDGTLGPRTAFPAGGQNPPFNEGDKFVTVADLNEDTNPDLAVADGQNSVISILLGNGNGGFAAKTDFPTGTAPYSIATGDLNEDSHLDIVTANARGTPSTVSVLLGNGDGTFGSAVDYVKGHSPFFASVAIGDLNGDGHLDLATANPDAGDSTLSVFLGDGSGTFAPRVDFVTGVFTWSVAISDLDGDDKADLVVANEAGTVTILMNAGTYQAPFAMNFPTQVDYVIGTNPNYVAIGDVNMDGKPDVAATSDGFPKEVSVALGNGDGTFASSAGFPAGEQPGGLVIGDFDGNNSPDLAMVYRGGPGDDGKLSILLNQCPPPTPSSKSTSATLGAGGTITTDAEGDGATPIAPIETSVTTPNAGQVSISAEPTTGVPPSGFAFLGQQILIVAPPATTANPLVLVFRVDASQLPPQPVSSIAIYRNGSPVPNCNAGTSASPDPCVAARILLGDGDGQFTVRTSAASMWTFAVQVGTGVNLILRSQQVLNELDDELGAAADKNDIKRLTDAKASLIDAVDSALWIDETHLDARRGERVFHSTRKAVQKLSLLIKDPRSGFDDNISEGWIDTLVGTVRDLALVAIGDAISTGQTKAIDRASNDLDKGNLASLTRPSEAIDHYGNAWNKVTATL